MEQGYANYLKRLNEEKSIVEKTIANCKIRLFNPKEKCISDLKILKKSLEQLSVLCGKDCPNWVLDILPAIDRIINDVDSANNKANLYSIISKYENSIKNHSWEDGGINIDFDFENIYEKYKRESKLDELLQEVITLLEKLLTNESLYNENVQKQVKRLLSIIKNNANKSFYSDEGIITCLFTFIADIAGVFIGIPGLGEVLKDFIKLAKSIATEMNTIKLNMSKEIASITKVPNLQIGFYDSDGLIKQIEDKTGTKIDFEI